MARASDVPGKRSERRNPLPSWSSLQRKGDSRKHPRFTVDGFIRILWQDSSGRERVSQARLVDVSAGGLKLSVEERIPAGSYLVCNDERLGIRGRGSVRYCNLVKLRYEIGVEFSGGTGWRPPAGSPASTT